MIKRFIAVTVFAFSSAIAFSQQAAQEKQEDESKMIREVVNVQVDRAQFAPPTPPPAPVTETKGKKGKHKTVEPPPEPAPDTASPMIPAPAGELFTRAEAWAADKKAKYPKSGCTAGDNFVSCHVQFPYKPKELNPTDNAEGEIDMLVVIEAKEGKYRLTIKDIKHKAKDPANSGGDIYATVPACGSMKIGDLTWKHIRATAFKGAEAVKEDVKARMNQSSKDAPKKGEW